MLIACGTRGILDAAFGPVRGKGTGEQALAGRLLGALRPGMLLLADRNFYSFALWNAAAATRADLLWRVSAALHLPVVRELPDGSFLARVSDPRAVQARNRRNGQRRRRRSRLGPETGPLPGMTVRVAEFTVTVTTPGGAARTTRYRLVTTLADWRRYPAPVLAACYARRWSAETGFAELKTALRGPGRALRGRTPALARQELWAYLAIYQAIRTLIARAAAAPASTPAGSPSPPPATPPPRPWTPAPPPSATPWPPPRARCWTSWSRCPKDGSAPAPSRRPAPLTSPGTPPRPASTARHPHRRRPRPRPGRTNHR